MTTQTEEVIETVAQILHLRHPGTGNTCGACIDNARAMGSTDRQAVLAGGTGLHPHRTSRTTRGVI